jgi:RNA polymerase sigma-70 factor (sigma-E family)
MTERGQGIHHDGSTRRPPATDGLGEAQMTTALLATGDSPAAPARHHSRPARRTAVRRTPLAAVPTSGPAPAPAPATRLAERRVPGQRTAGEQRAVVAREEREQDEREAERIAEADFTAYVRERRASLYATAYHLTGDRYEAEDLLQSALFSTYRAWGRIADKQAVGGYLRRTMTNLHISAWRRRRVSEYPTEEMPEVVGDIDAMRGTELRTVLWKALSKLPENQRTMLVLRYYDGRTDPEIADVLGISVGTVKSSIWRALRRLRDDDQLNFGEDHAFGELVA